MTRTKQTARKKKRINNFSDQSAENTSPKKPKTTLYDYSSRPCSPCLHVTHTPYTQRLADDDEITTSETLESEYEVPDLEKWESMLPFLKVVCQSKKSWEARETGIKFVQQIAKHMGSAILPHLMSLVEIIQQGLYDEIPWVRTITAMSLASLAEASAPDGLHGYGIICFESVLDPLVKGIKSECGETFAAYLKAIGSVIALMDALHAKVFIKGVVDILMREFQSHYEEMGEILDLVKQCVSIEGVEEDDYIRGNVLPEFFGSLLLCEWTDFEHRNELADISFEIAKKVGVADIVGRILNGLKNKREQCRIVAMKSIEKIVVNLGVTDIDVHLEELLLDGILYAFQEQTSSDRFNMILTGFIAVVNCLGLRVKPFLPPICDTIKLCLANKSCKVRQKAADAVSQIAVVLKLCDEEQLMERLGVVLREKLAEECPEVLGSTKEALKAIDQHL